MFVLIFASALGVLLAAAVRPLERLRVRTAKVPPNPLSGGR